MVGVPGGDLHVAQADAGVEHRRDEGVAQHVRVHPRHPDPGGLGQMREPASACVPVHPGAQGVAQDRTAVATGDRVVDGSGDRWRQGDEDDLAAFSAYAQDAVAVFLAEVADVGAAGFEDPQPRSPRRAINAKSFGLGDRRAAVIRASNCRWPSPSVGDSGGTVGRRT